MAAATFNNEDEEAQHCLSFLRDGTPSEKIAARNRLALIFTHRGLYVEATELYEANVRAGVHAPELFEQLSESYRRIGDDGAAEAALTEARRLREAARPRPVAAAPPPPAPPAPQPQPAPVLAQTASSSPASPPDDGPGQILQFPAAAPAAQPGSAPAVTSRMPASHRYDPDAELLVDEPAREARPRRQRGLKVPGPLLLLGTVVFLVAAPIVTLALLVVNPVALYLEGRPAGPTVDASSPTPARLKVAAGASASWYIHAGRSVSGLWATPGLELTLDQELDGAGAAFPVTAARPQGWGETITIVERRGQGRANQDTVLLATFTAPGALPPSGTVIGGKIAGQVTAPRLSESSQFSTTTEGIEAPVQLVVVSAPELWLDRFGNSLQMFFLEDRWLLVTIGALLMWCVLAGGAAILFRVRQS